jgi:hypothetical protein
MTTISPLRQRMIEDMNARKLHALTQKGHIRGCKVKMKRASSAGHADADLGEARIEAASAARSGHRAIFCQTARFS